jgi:hypothetical protein
VVKKKEPAVATRGSLKAKPENTPALFSAFAFQSQISEIQAAHVARRFGVSAAVAAVIATHAFGAEARR